MKTIKIRYTFIILASAIFLLTVNLQAALHAPVQDELPVPAAPSSWVSDYAGIFSESERSSLEHKLNEFEYRTSTQIFVVTLSDNGGYPADALAPLIGERWSVGQAGKDNGIVILVDMQDRDMFIATGYGNEEYVTDATSGLIVRNEIIPQFKQGNYYEGIDGATEVLISLLDGKFTADEYQQQHSSGGGGTSIGGIIFMIILLSILFGGRGRRSTGMGRSNLPLWLALGMLSGGGRHSGSWGSFSGGGGGGGGFGGFSGGGGGSFGGGGAGGSW